MELKDYIIAGLIVALVALAAYALTSGKNAAPAKDAPDASGARVYYLYPKRCVSCDLTKPGQCDYCNSYYDERVVGTVGADLGLSMEYLVSDAVESPNVMIINGGAANLADAKGKYILAKGLCVNLGGKSCEAFSGEISRTKSCIAKYNISEDTLVYHYRRGECIYCDKTTPYIDSLAAEVSYNDTYHYKVLKIDDKSPSERRILDDCFSTYVNLDYVPQVICPKTGESITGAIEKLSAARAFADKCIEGT